MEEYVKPKLVEHLEALSTGDYGSEIDSASCKGLKLVEARQGFFRFDFVVPSHLLDENGNWQAGAIATLVDIVGSGAAIYIVTKPGVAVEFSVSFYSTLKLQEEVEIVAKVVAQNGKLINYVVEITRKSNGELVAVGKQCMIMTGIQSKL